MPQHERKQCPRCKGDFECKSGSILLCQCSQIQLSAELLEYTQSKFNDCLCLSCLEEIQTESGSLHQSKISKNNKNSLL
ncbi:MAG: cysteine-rich CWC family protein [Gammaproteobacteria bacterium]|nr:cysteine-rich CWC family protein [Gammaproteobacteria bacterium]MCW8988061.1 cysteine-rich CWC family protein [Gammaproteobacteria bacterium]